MDNDMLRNTALLVYANKQDLPHSLTSSQIVEKLQLSSKFRSNAWFLQGAVAVTGEGLYEGLEWLSTVLNKT
jgi:ADP-ribosylation factor protein 1